MSQALANPGSPTQASVAQADSVSELLHHLHDVRQARSEDSVRLLQQLTPHLHAARAVERELDRHLDRRFNVFRYLRDDELGLSRIVADLLDPTGEHGQGTIFLEAMLELLGVAPEAGDSVRFGRDVSGGRTATATWSERFARLRSTAGDKIRVVLERGGLPGRRRIDITVDIPTGDRMFCLAFENKPRADDQPGQCSDYLKFLDRLYSGRFLLVYLPPRYRMPDKSSLLPADREHWKNEFRVLPYVADDAPPGDDDPSDGDDAPLAQVDSGRDDAIAEDDDTDHNVPAAQDDAAADGASLADWFGTCCKLSDAERLRWFLREAQLYCQHHFGDSTMTDTEARYIREYLDQNPRHLHAAFAVARAWPSVKHDVCRRFLEHLRDRVEERVREEFPEMAGDLDVGCHFGGDKRYSNYLRVYRSGWVRCDGVSESRSDGRTAVMLECGSGGPTSWHWGVRSGKSKGDMTETEKDRREEVEGALKRNGLSLPDAHHWPHIERPRHQDWTAIVPELVQELGDGGGKITDHYVDGLVGIAEKAIPAISEVELENTNPSGSRDS
ncbi:MAG: PD-(D/E)XK nuclease family protein [Gemmatimonadetes bacterium]|nr:PD-(D/E)XK nuclease family protein [Gemmatimonadota bacterium]